MTAGQVVGGLRRGRDRRGTRRGVFALANRVISGLVLVVILLAAGFGGKLLYDSAQPPVSTLMAGRWLTGRPVERTWRPLREIGPRLIEAVLMSEDGQFCNHHGVDWKELQDVMDDPDGPSRGASTITMQVARNLYLWNGRSVIRKGLEIPLALLLDAVWSKKRILEIYLNIAEWGDGLFGAEAASRSDFGKSTAQLSGREAALLATALPNPFLRHSAHPSRTHRELAAIDLARMGDAAEWTACVR